MDAVHIFQFAVALTGLGMQIRQACAPAVRGADVAAEVAEQRIAARAVCVAIGAGEIGTASDFSAEFHEQLGRRQPFQLHAVVAVGFAEQCTVHQAVVGKIPGVRMFLVLVAEARQEASALEREAVAEAAGLEPGFFDGDFLVQQSQIEVTA